MATILRNKTGPIEFDVASFDRARVLENAARYVAEEPITVTASQSARSAGGLHDFFSEGDYWWPDPKDPNAPYIRRDGKSNPENFVAHRKSLMRMSVLAPALAAAYKLTGDQRYSDRAAAHLRAWFVDPTTRMNPNLEYAQAIQGRLTGRAIGIIDTIHLVEVARAIPVVAESGSLSENDYASVKDWFRDYLLWLATSKNGMEERDERNNHGTCWVLQTAAYARLTGDAKSLKECAQRFKSVIVPRQIALNGSLPLELARTKPFNYCLFNLEALAATCRILAEDGDEELWNYRTWAGRSVRRAIEFMFPYIRDKKKWPKPADVEYFEHWPMRQQALLFGGLAYNRPDYIELWKTLPAESNVDEIIRNYFIRQPVLWID